MGDCCLPVLHNSGHLSPWPLLWWCFDDDGCRKDDDSGCADDDDDEEDSDIHEDLEMLLMKMVIMNMLMMMWIAIMHIHNSPVKSNLAPVSPILSPIIELLTLTADHTDGKC